jgi:soluble lytic murein transglycosylase
LDPYVVAGLIRQESLFNPVAVSPAGAIGLMQVMPATGRSLAQRVGIGTFNPEMLKQPETNVRLGTLFLADQMRRWNGHEPDVFAAYNAGPNRVVRWRQFPEHADEDLYAERIPFAETRDYVKKLRTNARIYRLLYAE